MLGLRHVAWGLPEKFNWLKSVALIFVTIDLTSQYKITNLTWFGTEILSLCGPFSQPTEQILFTRPCYQFITSCCLLWPVQILEETHPSVHAPFVAHDPNTVGTFPVPPDPAGKVSTSLFLISFFEQFAAPMRRFTQVHCGQTSLNSHLISFMIEWTHQERECYLWDSNFYPSLYSRFGFSGSTFSCSAWIQPRPGILQWIPPSSCCSPESLLPWYPHPSSQHVVHHLYACRILGERSVPSQWFWPVCSYTRQDWVGIFVCWWSNEGRFSQPFLDIHF